MSFHGDPVLALVPARKGSQGLRNKNISLCAGRPLIEYTLEAALTSRVIDDVYLSTNDVQAASIGAGMGVKVIARPEELCTAQATPMDVVEHFMEQLPTAIVRRDPFLVYMQPTSPLRSGKHVDLAFKEMEEAEAEGVVSVRSLPFSPYKAFRLTRNRRLRAIFDGRLSTSRRQELPAAYLPNGAIYVFRWSRYVECDGFPTSGSHAFVMSHEESIDIDSEADLAAAEIKLRKKQDA